MTQTRGGVWFMCGLGLVVSLQNLVSLYLKVGDRIGLMDWALLLLLLAGPPIGLRRYLAQVPEVTEKVAVIGMQIAMGGYVPLWFGLGLAARIASGR